MFSPDYGATWQPREIALDTAGGNLPYNLVADRDYVHILTAPGTGTLYTRRSVASVPEPASVGLFASAAMTLLRRRHRDDPRVFRKQ
jgi:hypothetical protein